MSIEDFLQNECGGVDPNEKISNSTDGYWKLKDIIHNYIEEEGLVKNLSLGSVINWVACSEMLPSGALGTYLVCLENNTIHELNYSDITKNWWHIAIGDIKSQNPVMYWAELPKPPCL